MTTGPPGLVATGTTLPGFSAKFSCNTKIREGIHGCVCHEVDTAPMAAVATIRPPSFYVFLTPETQAAVSTVTSLYANRCFVDEFHSDFIVKKKQGQTPPSSAEKWGLTLLFAVECSKRR
jgi:hypothetical protein